LNHTRWGEWVRVGEKVRKSNRRSLADQSIIYLQVKHQGKLHLTMNRHVNNERQEWKTGHVKGRVIAGGGGGVKRVKEGKHFLHMYEYGALKPVEEGKFMHIWKCHNETPRTTNAY
jgi:hypothetical protein